MIIGVPRERKTLEKRVAITPGGVLDLVHSGQTVLIERSAGLAVGFSDEEYSAAGATICDTLEEVWTRSELIVKVKEPHYDEYKFFRPGLGIFSYLHLASLPEVASELLKNKITGVAYELVQTADGRLPLLEPMSEIAGKLSVINGSQFLLSQHGESGILLAGAVGVPRARVLVLGAGISGRAACEMAFGLGADVTVLDIDAKKLEFIRTCFGNQVSTAYSTRDQISRLLPECDLLIGAVLIPGAAAPRIVSREMIRTMQNGRVFVDISIDQGGCAETSRPTNLDEPTYIEEGVVHYGVCNMPSQAARTATLALTAATLPYVKRLAKLGIEASLRQDTLIRNALNTYDGSLTNEKVGEALQLPSTPLDEAIH